MTHSHIATDIRIEQLRVRRGDALVVDGLDATLPAGAVTALVGGNGSGKSTLIEALAGLLPADSGRILGMPAQRALVVQRTEGGERLPLTGRQAVAMGLWRERGLLGRVGALGRARVHDALEAVGMLRLADRQLASMSGGERQRILVAQGLVQHAPLLLLDEPAAAADAEARDRIDAAVRSSAARGAVVVLATHDRSSLARADRAILLERGRLVAEGPPDEVAEVQARHAAAALAPQAAGGAVEPRMTSTGA